MPDGHREEVGLINGKTEPRYTTGSIIKIGLLVVLISGVIGTILGLSLLVSPLPEGFVYIRTFAPEIMEDVRYNPSLIFLTYEVLHFQQFCGTHHKWIL